MTIISVIVEAPREFLSRKPAKWILQHLKSGGCGRALLDLRDFPMPFCYHPATPAMPDAPRLTTRWCQRWTAAIAQS